MKAQNRHHTGEERRRYYRLQPTMPEKVLANLFFLGNKHCMVEVVNLSPGGILSYVNNDAGKFHKGDIIPRIDLQIPHKSSVTYAGEIVRVEPTSDPNAVYCAIKFEKYGGINGVKLSPKKKSQNDIVREEAILLTRLRQLENYVRQNSIRDEIHSRNRAYESFRDITDLLPMEEKWFFFELLDELKRQEPNYTPGLLNEYLRLCKGEEHRIAEASVHGLNLLLKRLVVLINQSDGSNQSFKLTR